MDQLQNNRQNSLPLALKPKQAAPLIGVGVNAIYNLCHRADFPAIKVGSGYIIPTDALIHWLNRESKKAG